MGKHIPKVGEDFEWQGAHGGAWYREGKVVLVTDKQVAVIVNDGDIRTVTREANFRPIPIKADVEREQLIEIMQDVSRGRGNFCTAADQMQKDGFTIPNKVKRSELSSVMAPYFTMITESKVEQLYEDMCKLLGDLVDENE